MTHPNFLVIGAQKCATSSMCDLIGQHPEAFMTDPKEPFFFSHDDIWERGWAWYESLFQRAGDAKAVGEGSTTYTQHYLYPHAVERIAAHLPDVKLIYMVRDPLERIRSQWMHNRSRGSRELLPFNEAVRTNPQYVDNSLYMKQIDKFRQRYSDDSILILFFECFKARPNEVMSHVYTFLGVDPTFRSNDAETPRHASAQGRVDRPGASMLRRIPGFEPLRDAAPSWFKSPLRHIFKQPIGGRPEWDDETQAWAISQIAEDAMAFVSRYGDGTCHWPIIVSQS